MHVRKKLLSISTIGLTIVFSASISFAQQSNTTTFEGILHSTGTLKGKTSRGKIFIKGQKVRIDFISPSTNHPITLLLNNENWTWYFLDSYDKTVEELAPLQHEQSTQKEPRAHTSRIETGNTEVIAGYLAQETLFQYEDGGTDHSWHSPELEISEYVVRGIQALCNGLPKKEINKAPHSHFVPLRTIRKLSDNTIWSHQEVEKIEIGNISDTLFEIPKDYTLHQPGSVNPESSKN